MKTQLEKLSSRVTRAHAAYEQAKGTRREKWCRNKFLAAGGALDAARRKHRATA